MTPEEIFRNDDTKRSALAQILKNPVFVEAIEALQDSIDPRSDLPATLASETVSAHRYHQFAGANHIVKGLARMTTPSLVAAQLPAKALRPPKPTDP